MVEPVSGGFLGGAVVTTKYFVVNGYWLKWSDRFTALFKCCTISWLKQWYQVFWSSSLPNHTACINKEPNAASPKSSMIRVNCAVMYWYTVPKSTVRSTMSTTEWNSFNWPHMYDKITDLLQCRTNIDMVWRLDSRHALAWMDMLSCMCKVPSRRSNRWTLATVANNSPMVSLLMQRHRSMWSIYCFHVVNWCIVSPFWCLSHSHWIPMFNCSMFNFQYLTVQCSIFNVQCSMFNVQSIWSCTGTRHITNVRVAGRSLCCHWSCQN